MQTAPAQASDHDIRNAVGALFAAENRRMLGRILSDAPQPAEPWTTPLKTSLPAALHVAVTSVNSAGEGRGVYPALQDNPRFHALVNADPDRVVRVATEALATLPQGGQSHESAVRAAFSRDPAPVRRTGPRLRLLVLQGGGA